MSMIACRKFFVLIQLESRCDCQGQLVLLVAYARLIQAIINGNAI